MASERGLIQRAKRNLERHGFRVEEQALVGSSAPDLVVTSPQGTSAVIEAKEWPASEAGMRRASDLAHVYSSVSGSFAAFTLLPYVPPSSSAPNVISPDYLDPLISRLSRPPSSSARKPRLKRGQTPSVNLFVAMPFDGRFEKPFEIAVKPAAIAAGMQCGSLHKE